MFILIEKNMKPIYILISFLLLSCGSNEEFILTIKQLNDEVKELQIQNEKLQKDLELCNAKIQEEEKRNENGIELIGKWSTPDIYGGGEVIIEKANGKYYKTETFRDKTSFKKEMILKNEGISMVFWEKDSQSSDIWVVKGDGTLQVRDNDGIIYNSNKN